MFQCVGMLAAAVGPNLTKLLHDQLDLMFACGLSEPLHHALIEIAKNIPPLLKTIQGNFPYLVAAVILILFIRSSPGYAVDDPQ
jgi:FKBP12-rapamycin complex-associated protein